ARGGKDFPVAVRDGNFAHLASSDSGQWLATLGRDARCGLVLAAANIDAMPDVTILRKLGEVDFNHDLWLQPASTGCGAARLSPEGIGITFQSLEKRTEFLQIVHGKARSHASAVTQSVILKIAQQERGEGSAGFA